MPSPNRRQRDPRQRRRHRCTFDAHEWRDLYLTWKLTNSQVGALVNAMFETRSWGRAELTAPLLRMAGVREKALKRFLELGLLVQDGDVYRWGTQFIVWDDETDKPKRVALSNKTRFQVLERDGFKCRYCGRDSGETKLHIDHVLPVVKGGTDDLNNLVAACADCNFGKRDRILGEAA